MAEHVSYDPTQPPSTGEVAQNTEIQLSPEVIEQIMEKVQDIDQDGTAFSQVYCEDRPQYTEEGKNALKKGGFIKSKDLLDHLASMFRSGILGRANAFHTPDETERKKKWKKEHKSGWARVYFNIAGRIRDVSPNPRSTQIARAGWTGRSFTSVNLIFDPKRFKEVPPNKENDELQINEYVSHDIQRYYQPGDDYKKLKADSEYGFKLSSRVRPSDFKGIVFEIKRDLLVNSTDELKQQLEVESDEKTKAMMQQIIECWKKLKAAGGGELPQPGQYDVYENRLEVMRATAKEIAQTMIQTDQGKPERLMPIYDSLGNMWWPKEMSYEEVKEFAAARQKEDARGTAEDRG